MFKVVAAALLALLIAWGVSAPSTSPSDMAPAAHVQPAPPARPEAPKPKLTAAPAAPVASRRGTPTQNGYFLNLNAIPQLVCEVMPAGATDPTDKQLVSGTGTIIGRGRVLTAAHVVRGATGCKVKGKPAVAIYADDRLDIAVLAADLGDTPVVPISCDGFEAGQAYFGIGYAHGRDFAVQLYGFTGQYLDLTVEGRALPHIAGLVGSAFHGMSGGPLVDGLGRVTGVLTAGDDGDDPTLMVSRDLADTPLCAALKLPPPEDKPAAPPAQP